LPVVSSSAIDTILSLQLLVAWAGESARLSWWNTNFIDPDGGLDLLGRVAPRTGAVAAWELVRAAAVAADADRRGRQAEGDRLITLFHLREDVEEAVADRLRALKMSGGSVAALPGVPAVDARFDRAAFTARLGSLGAADAEPRAAGRRLKGPMPSEPELLATRLAAALLPLADHYPMPYFGAA
jgi:hypothetical protein